MTLKLAKPTGASLKLAKPTGAKLLMRTAWQPMDADAAAYITAVETADGQALEEKTKIAIDNFVLGCKADGIWSAIKASCILAGARTLSGALVPLVGTAPTNFNFVAGDYNRKTGLVGDASTKYLNSRYAPSLSLQNNCHGSAYLSSVGTGGNLMGFNSGVNFAMTTSATRLYSLSVDTAFANTGATGFRGMSRSSSSSHINRSGGVNVTGDVASTNTAPDQIGVFARFLAANGGSPNGLTNARLAFYSIGESLNLALLDARVTDLINAFGAAIP